MTSYSPMISNKALFITLALCLLIALPAMAEDDRTAGSIPKDKPAAAVIEAPEAEAPQEEEPKEEQALKSVKEKTAEAPAPKSATVKGNLGDIESTGLLKAERDGSLGSNLWKGASRSSLTDLLTRVPAEEESRTITELKRRVLLTAASARNISGSGIEPGKDLLTLRLKKLMDMGFYREAFEMYAQLNGEAYDSKLGEAGIMAMLYAGEKSLACLEAKSAEQRFSAEPFWTEILAYCDVTLSAKPAPQSFAALRASNKKVFQQVANNANFRFLYNPQAFENLDQIEQAVLAADKRIDAGNMEANKAIPARHLQLLLNNEKLSDKARTLLTIQAVRHAIASPSALEELYASQAEPAAGDAAAQTGVDTSGWQALPQLYNAADNAERTALGPILQQAFALKRQFGTAALTPFASYIEKINPTNPSLYDIQTAFEIMQMSGRSLPLAWADSLEKLAPNADNAVSSKTYYNLYIPVYVGLPDFRQTEEARQRIKAYVNANNSKHSALVKIIIENLDNGGEDNDNAAAIYEKDFGLTSKDDYVMPSVDVWDRLREASQDKSLSETILLSALALQGNRPGNLYPGLLRDVLNGFETVGLTEFSKSLAIEALLED
jgi:hypothetical protein